MREENVAESGSIFVRNLPYTVSQEQLTELFESFGKAISQILYPFMTKGSYLP